MSGILLVHGAWHGPWYWEGFVDRLKESGHDVRAAQLRGHDQPPGRIWHRVQHYVEDVQHAMAAFSTPPFLIGHSMGGLVVQKCLERSSCPGAVLLASTPSGGTAAAVARLAARHPIELLKANLLMRLRPLVVTPDLVRELFFTPDTARRLSPTALRAFRTNPTWPSSIRWWFCHVRTGFKRQCLFWEPSGTRY